MKCERRGLNDTEQVGLVVGHELAACSQLHGIMVRTFAMLPVVVNEVLTSGPASWVGGLAYT